MKHPVTLSALALSLLFDGASAPEVSAQEAPSPTAIVAAAPAAEWNAVPAEDLLVMELDLDRDGNTRTIIIQLMPPPFSQPWVENIRNLAREGWYDGISINRVQDNYVVQWGDPNHDNPEASGPAKPLPAGLRETEESGYVTTAPEDGLAELPIRVTTDNHLPAWSGERRLHRRDAYADHVGFHSGWPVAGDAAGSWPVHCYGMVGVGRGMSPDAGSGAELYTVIGHAPRHLDRNIALVGRVIEGIEHLSSLPRGTGDLGFYEDPAQRVPIKSIRIAADLPEGERPAFEYLSTESDSFESYADARANRRDPFFIEPAGGADICNIPVPVRRVPAD